MTSTLAKQALLPDEEKIEKTKKKEKEKGLIEHSEMLDMSL